MFGRSIFGGVATAAPTVPTYEEQRGLLASPAFWEEEKDAGILLRDGGYVQEHKDRDDCQSLFALGEQWCRDAGVTHEQAAVEAKALEEHSTAFMEAKREFKRIFVKDAERTFQQRHNHDEDRLGDYDASAVR